MTDLPSTDYVDAVLTMYRRLPDVATRPRCADRELARDLHRRGVPVGLLEAALTLATLRRRARHDDNAAPLTPVRSLHYYLPVIEELLERPPADGYLDYLRDRLADPSLGARPENDVFS